MIREQEITRPTLIVDLQQCEANIKKMVGKADNHNLLLRPHFKTHQSNTIGEIYRKLGVKKITVSSVQMAQKFADNGWQDITVAFPFNPLEIREIEELNQKVKLKILISSRSSAQKLAKISKDKFNYFIEVDAGYHRSGILAEDILQIEHSVNTLSDHKFIGFLTHAGNTYNAGSTSEILEIHHNTLKKMKALKGKFKVKFPHLILSIGDTPACTLATDFSGVDEIRPGNFVFYDLMQYNLEVCKFEDISVCVACPVVDVNKDRNEIVIYGGAVHLSKEHIFINEKKIFGQVVKFAETKWDKLDEDIFVTSLSQEHGIIKASDDLIDRIEIGDLLGVIPIHSCLTTNLLNDIKLINTDDR